MFASWSAPCHRAPLIAYAIRVTRLQEACFICNGPDGAGAVMKVAGRGQDALWAAIERSDVTAYRAQLSGLHVVPCEVCGVLGLPQCVI